MAEEKTLSQQNKKDKKKNITAGIIFLILIVISGVYLWHKITDKPKVENLDVSSAIAVVDVNKLISNHVNYAQLTKLQAEKIQILYKLKTYAVDTKSLEPPEINPAKGVFEQVVAEQDNLRDIKLKQQLKEETASKENELRNNIAKEKNEAIAKINDKYTNEILNCTIKLDNADNLKLSKNEMTSLLERLEQLKIERGQAVNMLEKQYNLRIANELMAWRQNRQAQLGLNNVVAHQEDVNNSNMSKQQEAMRDSKYLQDRLEMLKARKKDSERLLVLLHTKDNEIELLQKSILKDIASKASKIAVQKHLKFVIANVPLNMNFFGNPSTLEFGDNILSGMVVGIDTIDITDDIIVELDKDKEILKSKQNNN